MICYCDLTEEQRGVLCNGCGPKGGGSVVPGLFLHEICDEHDFDDWVGGSILDRWRADWKLLRNGQKKAGWNLAKHAACLTYWTAVRAGGAFCFHYGKKRDEKNLEKVMEICAKNRKTFMATYEEIVG